MSRVEIGDRKASPEDVRTHRALLRRAASEAGLSEPRLRSDGAIVVHTDAPDYSQILSFAARALHIVGAYVHVIADTAPAARRPLPDL